MSAVRPIKDEEDFTRHTKAWLQVSIDMAFHYVHLKNELENSYLLIKSLRFIRTLTNEL